MRRLWQAAPALLLFLLPAAARADERIQRYVSDVHIQKDSSIEVTETIDVTVEHININHGIYRDFPTRYRGRNGTQFHVGFTFEGATLDGSSVKASIAPNGNGVRIKIGDADTLVPEGPHEYVIRYRATREIGRFPQFDELYWNATGNNWMFPIDVAEARITLPEPAQFGQRAAYTGAQGSTQSNAEVVDERPGSIAFRTTQPLDAYEGLTVAVAFPKGIVAASAAGGTLEWLADYGPPLLGLLSLVALCSFYYVAWKRAGRNPRAGTVVPMFSPPDGLSPAGMRYVTKMMSDNRTFAAALVDMGVRGHVRLVEEDGGWLSSKKMRLERLNGSQGLAPEEEAALDCLCQPGEDIMMQQSNHEKFSTAKEALSGILKTEYEGKLFRRNLGWAAAGLLFFAALFWLTCAAVAAATYGAIMWQIGIVVGSLVVAALLWLAFHDSPGGKCLLSLAAVIAFAVASWIGMPVLAAALNSGWWLPIVLPLLAAPIVISAFWWMAAPTPKGREVLDHIAGFKQYLSITEAERLDRMTSLHPPPDTPATFEKYLPFAIALAVENHWAKRFQGVLAAASAQGQHGFAWYSGSSSPWSSPTSFVDSVGSSLSSAVGSASTAPGSSGGGSSGGGGGGGGGGGW